MDRRHPGEPPAGRRLRAGPQGPPALPGRPGGPRAGPLSAAAVPSPVSTARVRPSDAGPGSTGPAFVVFARRSRPPAPPGPVLRRPAPRRDRRASSLGLSAGPAPAPRRERRPSPPVPPVRLIRPPETTPSPPARLTPPAPRLPLPPRPAGFPAFSRVLPLRIPAGPVGPSGLSTGLVGLFRPSRGLVHRGRRLSAVRGPAAVLAAGPRRRRRGGPERPRSIFPPWKVVT
ncbi:hypothetical protein EIO00_06490 [Thermomonospora catenispora]|nr:hypothetical protein EIO00_06490 [Thermomonospora catenispora]